MSARDRLTEAGFGMGWSAVKALPEPAARRMFQAIADRTWSRQGQSVLQLKANLSRVLTDEQLPLLDDIAHEGVRRYLRYWCEAFRLPALDREEIVGTFACEREEVLWSGMEAGRGVIAVLPHMGNWDHAGAWAALTFGGIITVAERLKPEGLFDKFVAFRESLGIEVFALGDADVMRQLVRSLKEGRMVCLLADRDISQSGMPVNFFGQQASMPAGPAMLSLMTGAPLVPASLWHTDDKTVARIGDPLPAPAEGPRRQQIQELTQLMADAFAAGVRERPADWHMMQPLWKSDLRTAPESEPSP